MSSNEWQIDGIRLFGGDKEGVLKLTKNYREKRPFWIATVNPEFVQKARKDVEFRRVLQLTTLNVVDGIALIWAREAKKWPTMMARLATGWETGQDILRGYYDNQVVRGSELMVDLVKQSPRVFLLGGFGDGAEKTGEYLKKITNHKPQITTCIGEPGISDDEVIKQIKAFKPELLLVAYGMVKQEKWIAAHMDVLEKAGVRVVMGVGRSFDYYSGRIKQAPVKWRKMGLEWLYSLIQDPKRLGRQMEIPKFIGRVIVYG